MRYEGSCHCGNIAYEVEGDIDSLMACNCSICSRRGYLLWFVPREAVKLKTPENNMSSYTFNTHKIQHNFCPTCGCAPVGFGEDPRGNEVAAINARCIPDLDLGSLQINHFDGRSV
ncbi:GFA family protein [Marinobacter nanhaiticus D15-8W]|uniref:GFA family protein n=1 Tax=Marinobacter nanhaiticus D15-8W TaxID=626887 RepID=N6W7X0_9GAMM|nr:GFA family protein [Marinobacter nanhaiticus]ENO16354.1 GFA family protein [Marinobacter nanhaiticus D15-8W]BES72785.1 GFA family protein [Marinobacter nanhaiticus D15-8W]